MGSPAPAPDVFTPRVFGAGLPHDAFARLRDQQPVSWQAEPAIDDWPPGPGFWAVTRHADVKQVLQTPATYSSWLGATQIRDPEPTDLDFIRRMILNMDAPEHLRLRRLVTAAFTRRRLEQSAERIRARAGMLIDAVRADGGCDLPVQLTNDFPLANLADLIGVPPQDRALLLSWTDRVIGYQDPEHGDVVRDAEGRPINPRSPMMLTDMFDYALRLAETKRRHPGNDVMTDLVQAEVDGEHLADAELQMFFFLLVIAGNDTVRSALPGGVLALCEHPDDYARLRAHPDLLPTAIEEMLRWHPPVLSFRRTATADTSLAGQQLQRGDKVVVYHAAAHFDERAFADPFRFDIARKPNDHIAFGFGPHVCLGAIFARLQLRIFFTEFLGRLPQAGLAAAPTRLVSNFINGLTHLPITWPV